MSRYYVDCRGGCVAVRDELKVNEDEQGLHEDMQCVVAYWMGFRGEDNNGMVCWNVHGWQLKKANDLAELLNKTQSA